MISIPIQNRVAPLIGALAAGLWFAMVVAAILLVASGTALASDGRGTDTRWPPVAYGPVHATPFPDVAGYRYHWRRGYPYAYGRYRGRYASPRWCPFGR